MTRLRPRTARTAAAGLVAAAALVLSGCSATNPIQTIDDYEASDGLAVTVGSVRAQNLIVLAEEDGGPGVLTGALANDSRDDETVTVTVAGSEAVTVPVPGSGTVLLGVTEAHPRYTTADVVVPAVDGAPGGMTGVTLTTRSGGTVEVRVPVLDGTLPEYTGLVPTAVATPDQAMPDDVPTEESTQDATAPDENEVGDTEG